jgi:TPR repeat protein
MSEAKIEAYKWFHLSAEQGYGSSITACNTISFGMSREDVTEGLSRAAAFLVRLTSPVPAV